MGEEPSGRGYDEIALDANGQPHNPMINRWRSKITLSEAFDSYSGAILSASMLLYMVQPELSTSEKFEFVQNYFQRMAGGMPVGFQNTVRGFGKMFSIIMSRSFCLRESPQIATTPLPSLWGRTDASQSDYSCIVNINAIKLNQGTQHYKRLRGHQDHPWLLLPTLLSWDDNRKHVSKTTQENLKYWVSKVSDGSNLSKRGNMPGDIREGSGQRICEECAQSDVQLWWVSSHLLSKLLL